MLLALSCALCAAAAPAPQIGAGPAAPTLLDARLSLELTAPPPVLVVTTVPALPLVPSGSGDGDHSDHMAPMWIMMGVVMAVMMVGMGVYLMNHESPPQTLTSAGAPPRAQLALPPSPARGGGG